MSCEAFSWSKTTTTKPYYLIHSKNVLKNHHHNNFMISYPITNNKNQRNEICHHSTNCFHRMYMLNSFRLSSIVLKSATNDVVDFHDDKQQPMYNNKMIEENNMTNDLPILKKSSRGGSGFKPLTSNDWAMNKFPAKEYCSKCGLCETSYIQNVTDACAFLHNNQLGMGQLNVLEKQVHGKSRNVHDMVWAGKGNNNNNLLSVEQISNKNDNSNKKNINVMIDRDSNIAEEGRFGVLFEPIQLVKGIQMDNSQWTGVVTSIAIAMLETKQVDAVICIANRDRNDQSSSWSTPEPIIAKTVQDVLRGRGVKPSLAPSLRILDELKNDKSIKRLLFCGVGCSVQALRVIEKDLQLQELYVLGTNCVDNSPSPNAAEKFIRKGLQLNTIDYPIIYGYEFMQDYRVHIKTEKDYIMKPYFTLPGTIAEESIAKSCLTCFDYTNALADVVIGYMGAPYNTQKQMNQSYQTITIRNERGYNMIQTAINAGRIQIGPIATGYGSNHEQLVLATVESDAIVQGMIDRTQIKQSGMPMWLGEIFSFLLRSIGPKGINFARYSIDYHILRNYLYILYHRKGNISDVNNNLPLFVSDIVQHYIQSNKQFSDLVTKIGSTTKKTK